MFLVILLRGISCIGLLSTTLQSMTSVLRDSLVIRYCSIYRLPMELDKRMKGFPFGTWNYKTKMQ